MQFKSFLIALVVVASSIGTQQLNAQTGDKKAPTTLPNPSGKPAVSDKTREALNEKLKQSGMPSSKADAATAKMNDVRASRAAAVNSVSDVQLVKDEQKITVTGFKTDFLAPTTDAEAPRLSIVLYTDKAEKLGKINFYDNNAKVLKDKKTLDDKGAVNMSYSMDMFDTIQQFLNTSMRVFVVVSKEAKTAYLTSDIVPTRSR